MTNILQNPTLSGFALNRYFWDKSGNTGAIEFPDNWEYVVTPMNAEDPGLIPQSLHRDKGFVISAAWRSWEAGYVQRSVALKAGQRYVAKAQIFPDVNFPADQPVDLTAITWRFWIEQSGGGEKVFQDWQMTTKSQYKTEETVEFVFQSNVDVTVDFFFKARSVWAGNACDLHIYSFALEDVDSSVGGAMVPMLGGAPAPKSVENDVPIEEFVMTEHVDAPVHEENLPAASESSFAPGVAGLQKLSLADVLSADDIEVIAAGFRRMDKVTSDKIVIEAFNRFAEALEKLR